MPVVTPNTAPNTTPNPAPVTPALPTTVQPMAQPTRSNTAKPAAQAPMLTTTHHPARNTVRRSTSHCIVPTKAPTTAPINIQPKASASDKPQFSSTARSAAPTRGRATAQPPTQPMMVTNTHHPARNTARRSTSHCTTLIKTPPIPEPTMPPTAMPTILASTHQSQKPHPTCYRSTFMKDPPVLPLRPGGSRRPRRRHTGVRSETAVARRRTSLPSPPPDQRRLRGRAWSGLRRRWDKGRPVHPGDGAISVPSSVHQDPYNICTGSTSTDQPSGTGTFFSSSVGSGPWMTTCQR